MLGTVIFISEAAAIRIIPRDTDALISITDARDADLHADWKHIIRVQFNDIDVVNESCWTVNGKPMYKLFDEKKASQIRTFVNELYNDDAEINLIVHCHAGISRSAAVAKYVAERYDLDFPKSYSVYNRKVYSTLNGLDWQDKFKGQIE